ncbi:hypothetical protein [Pseudomonas sp. microsymbiont 2]
MSRLVTAKGKGSILSAQPSEIILAAPVPVGVLPLLDDENGALTLALEKQIVTLPFRVKAWEEYESDYRQLIESGYESPRLEFQPFWNDRTVGEVVQWDMTPSIDEDENGERFIPVDLSVPASIFVPGEGRLKFEVWVDEIFNRELSPEARVRIDQMAPNMGRPCPLREDNVTVIDEAYLEQNGNKATFKIDRWDDIRLEDKVQLFLLDSSVSDTTNLPFNPSCEVDVNVDNKRQNPFLVDVPAAKLTNGMFRVVCRLLDRSGNVGVQSPSLDVQVLLPVPVVLPFPQVPLANDGLLDLEDARTPVQVEIPRIEAAEPGDVLQVYWNTRPLQAVTVGATQQWPVRVDVPWADITAQGFVGPVLADVYYTSSRHGGSQETTGIQVSVDLRVAGPDPEGPEPENPRLAPVVVKGRTGDNHLGIPDINQDVTVEVLLYPQPEPGQTLQLHWNDSKDSISTYEVKEGDQGNTTITFPLIPYDQVKDSSGRVPVHYWTSNGVNRQRSPATLVTVAWAATYPRPAYVVPYVNIYGNLSCDSLYKAISKPIPPTAEVPFDVPASAGLQVGEHVRLRWQLYRKELPEFVATGEEQFSELVPVSNANQTLRLFLGPVRQALHDQFEDFRKEGQVRVWYDVVKSDGSVGFSHPLQVRVDFIFGSGMGCEFRGDK